MSKIKQQIKNLRRRKVSKDLRKQLEEGQKNFDLKMHIEVLKQDKKFDEMLEKISNEPIIKEEEEENE